MTRRIPYLRWLACPHHGPLCRGAACCCADAHWSLRAWSEFAWMEA